MLLLVVLGPVGATEFVVVNQDAAAFGFNDTTPVAPVGGNDGTTLGQQRLNVLQRAGEIWSSYLYSVVPIRVQGQFADYGGTPEGGFTLAGASSLGSEINFPNAPQTGVIYPVALANSLAGVDLDPAANDINVTINIALDTDPALEDWYYGLDGNAPSDRIDLLDVLLHELGHGLGFSSRVDLNNGAFLLGYFDIYSLHLFDTEASLFWNQMNNPGRKNSARNEPFLVWAGDYTTAAASRMLLSARVIDVTSPPAVAGEYAYEGALFGPAVPEGGISGTLVLVDDGSDPVTDACQPILNAGELAGAIAYIDRGSCNFNAKTLKAQQAGAIAVIIANNVDGGPLFMSGDSVVDGIPLVIPAVSISLADGLALKAASPGVTLKVGKFSGPPAGTTDGYVRIYAPAVAEPGSSISHWSPSANPDLLMEPFINPVLREDLDLSLTLMKDIGWTVIDIPYPYLNYSLWVDESFAPAATLTAQGDDPDEDGLTNVEEYFFGGDPESPSVSALPRMQLGAAAPELVYTRSKLPADLAFAYEISGNLVDWADAGAGVDYIEELTSPVAPGVETVTLKLPAPGDAPAFLRLRIESLP